MKERNFNGLIVRHRKSAVFFMRETDLNVEGYVSPWWKDKTPVFHPSEMRRKYTFSPAEFKEFVVYLEQIANEAWKDFKPREADSWGAEYREYYDREFGTEGDLQIGKYFVDIEGPYQPKTNDSIIRLYKFNKRKFESFIYELHKLCNA